MGKLLSICKPTYNRKDVIISDIKQYLQLKDQRFNIKVNDNHSTDGTIDELSKIKDDRLLYNVNQTNKGTILNTLDALSNTDSKYIMLLLDKDTIDTTVFPKFLDYLERDEPCFGYVDLKNKEEYRIENFSPGIESINKVAYLCKHPSGFFWRADIFEAEINNSFYNNIKTFDFIFDCLNGPIASKYPATIVYMPLIINANIRTDMISKKYKGSYGYDASNIWFGKEKRTLEYEIYLKSALSLEIPKQDKIELIKKLTIKGICSVSTSLHAVMLNKSACEHYNLHTRKVSFIEMIKNTHDILKIFKKNAKEVIPHIFLVSLIMEAISLLRDLKCLIKAIFIKSKDGTSV